ncbi:MAG TPA: hypothetical protein VH142_01805 [Polyangiaceae bacterium]|nr:hypothetical protein [Polyangiaceae bacterium]
MQPFTEPLGRLREALRWFVAVRELRLLHVVTSAELRLPSLHLIASSQTSARNHSPFALAATDAQGNPADWDARAAELDDAMAKMREDAASSDPPFAMAAPPPLPSNTTGLSRFAATARGQASLLKAPMDGLVVVLAPGSISAPTTWVADLRRLLGSAALDRIRFVVVEPEPGPSRALANELGRAAEHVEVTTDGAGTTRATAVMLAGMKSAPLGADPARLAGMAGPREAPPPRLRHAALDPGAAAAALSSAGVAPALADASAMQALRIQITSAALAQREGRAEDAIGHQRDARDLAAQAGLVRESILLDLMLGAHLVQAGGYAGATRIFDRVLERAHAASLSDLEAQAYLAKGGTLLAQGRPEDAAAVYTTGGQVAEAAGLRPFAIESFRMVGQILSSRGHEAEAGTAFHRALGIAKAGEPLDRRTSSAPVAAGDLAAIYRKNGLTAQAESLEAEAKKWQAEVPDLPPAGGLVTVDGPRTEAAPALDSETAFAPPLRGGKGPG